MRSPSGLPGLVLVAVLTAIACSPSIGNEFAYDDGLVVRAVSEDGVPNRMVHRLRPVSEYFTTEYWDGATGGRMTNALYRPVTVFSFALTHRLFPGDGTVAAEAVPHHALNVLLHVIDTVLVFFVAAALLRRDSFAPVAAAAVFGLAGIHAEAVAAIVGRADLLAFGFGAGALLCALRARGDATPATGTRKGTRARLATAAAAAVLLFLAYCSKESALAWWPFAVCASVLRGPTSRRSWRDAAWPACIGLVPAALWFALRAATFADLPEPAPAAHVANPLHGLDAGPRALAALLVWGHSLVKMLVPYPLASDYGAKVFGFAEPGAGFAALDVLYLLPILVAAGVGIVAFRRGQSGLLLGVLALLGFGFTTSNIAVLIGTIWGERLAYLPSVGIALAIGWLFQAGGRTRGTAAADLAGIVAVTVAGIVAAWCVANAVVLFKRTADWKDNDTLFSKDVTAQPDSLLLKLQLAIQEQRRGDWQGWQDQLDAAIALEPEWARPYIELAGGRIARLEGTRQRKARPEARFEAQLAGSERLLQRALRAKICEPYERAMAWRNLGVIALKRGAPEKAFPWFRKILDADGSVLTRHRVLADFAAAFDAEQLRQVLDGGEARQPGHPLWALHRGLQAARQRRWKAARTLLEEALPRTEVRDRAVQNAWIVLGELREKTGDADAARQLFRWIAGDRGFGREFRAAAARRVGG